MGQALKAKGVPVELMLYERGGHMAFNLPSPAAGDWPLRFKACLDQTGSTTLTTKLATK